MATLPVRLIDCSFFRNRDCLQTPPIVVKQELQLSSLMGQAHMNPEEKARIEIDRQLIQCGWDIQDYKKINLSAGFGIAVRKFPLITGEAD